MYYVYTDHLGSYNLVLAQNKATQLYCHYDPWGNLKMYTDWRATHTSGSFVFDRGFTGHEHLDGFKIINMNARLYDPVIGRFFSPDPQVQSPNSTQSYNRYSYCMNNPIMFNDPDGEFIVASIIMGVAGMYAGGVMANNDYNPINWDYSSGKTWTYMIGGGITGFCAGYAGITVAGSGIPMANTLGLTASSIVYSIGTYVYTGGNTPFIINIGIASYDITNNTLGYLGKKENTWYENAGYLLGGIMNISDVYQYVTWDRLSLEERYLKLEKYAAEKYGEKNMRYDPSRKGKNGAYNPNNKEILIHPEGLNRSWGWAKSTYQHELSHRTTFLPKEVVMSMSDPEQYLYIKQQDARSYRVELKNALKNGLSSEEFKILQDGLYENLNFIENRSIVIPKYNTLLWLRSLLP